jgi:hypothetical protein
VNNLFIVFFCTGRTGTAAAPILYYALDKHSTAATVKPRESREKRLETGF